MTEYDLLGKLFSGPKRSGTVLQKVSLNMVKSDYLPYLICEAKISTWNFD